jgi:uncharacterized protein YkwD
VGTLGEGEWEMGARRIVLAVALATASTSLLALPAQAGAATNCLQPAESTFARLVNRARVAHGLGRLRVDTQLNRISAYHSREMRTRNLMYHTPSTTLSRRITHESAWGENIAWTTGARSMSPSAEAHRVLRMFMH